MKIQINGQFRDFPDTSTIHDVLAAFELLDERVAVEHNGVILDRESFESKQLESGDVLEVVRFVGGG